MNIIIVIIFAIIFAITVVIISLIIMFSSIAIEYRFLIRRNAALRKGLNIEEVKLIKLTNLIISLTSLINCQIYEIMSQQELLQDKKCNCNNLSENTSQDQKSKL